MEKRQLEKIERFIFDLFQQQGTTRLLAKEIFASSDEFANADLVRAFEDLEKKWRLLVRYTKDGNDWVSLTADGATYAGVDAANNQSEPGAFPHPPKSVT